VFVYITSDCYSTLVGHRRSQDLVIQGRALAALEPTNSGTIGQEGDRASEELYSIIQPLSLLLPQNRPGRRCWDKEQVHS
jgi:hypothetical protein